MLFTLGAASADKKKQGEIIMTEISLGRSAGTDASSAPGGADEFAGLLHDLGHQIMTVSLLAEALQADQCLSADSRRQTELLVQETARALGMIADTVPSSTPQPNPAPVTQLIDARELAARITRLAGHAFEAAVRLQPGPPVYMQVNPMLVWRVLWNVVENAGRAAGPDGQVEISIRPGNGTVIEVTDNGAGYGKTDSGVAGLGLSVVTQLLATTGGQLDIAAGRDGGTTVRAIFGSQCERIVLPRSGRARMAAR
jgi:signal transduction histidine kinase